MFGMGMPELIVILLVALIVIGPKKLPDLARALGKGLAEFRKATQDLREEINIRPEIEEVKTDVVDTVSGRAALRPPAGKTAEEEQTRRHPSDTDAQPPPLSKRPAEDRERD